MSQGNTRTPSRPKRGGVLLASSWLYLLLLMGLWWSHLNLAEGAYWLPTLAAYIPQYPYGVPAALLLLGSLLSRNWSASIINLAGLGFWLLALMGFAFPKPVENSNQTLRVMSYNVRLESTIRIEPISKVIREQQPDVLCMQEIFDWGAEELSKEFKGWYWEQAREVAIFSRYPLENIVVHNMPGNTRKILEADLNIAGKRLKLVCVHHIAITLIDRRSRRPRFDTFVSEDRVRDRTTALLLQIATDSPYPVIVAGDFNTPPRVGVYRTMQNQMTDAWAQRGWGLGSTYSSSRPLLRIDYLWLKGLQTQRIWVVPTKASDHFPLVADLSW